MCEYIFLGREFKEVSIDIYFFKFWLFMLIFDFKVSVKREAMCVLELKEIGFNFNFCVEVG